MQENQVAFGLYATTIALKAKSGQLRIGDQIEFALRALEMVHDDPAARVCVIDFLTHCELDPHGAGERLQDFIIAWPAGSSDPRRPEQVLKDMPETTADWRPDYKQAAEPKRRTQ